MNKETKLQNEIRAELSAHGCVVLRCNTGLYYTADGRKVKCGTVGHSDLYGHRIADGKAFYLEIKNPGEKPRPEQVKFLSAMRNTGAIAGVAHSVDEAIDLICS